MGAGKIHTPWSAAQVAGLNAYQREGRMHPFTCGREHTVQQVLVAEPGDWRCPDAECDYRQSWAWAAMAGPHDAPAGAVPAEGGLAVDPGEVAGGGASPMTEAEIIDDFRTTYGPMEGWGEHHLANCPGLRVLRWEATGPDTFTSVLVCPHARPLGFSRFCEEPED